MIHPDHSFPFLHPSQQPHPPLSPIHSPLSPFREEQTSKRQQLNKTKQNTIRQDESLRTDAGQGNTTGGKESKTHLLPPLVPQKHQANNCNTCTED